MIYADILAQNTLLEFKDASKICNYSGGRFCFPLRKRGIEGESEARGGDVCAYSGFAVTVNPPYPPFSKGEIMMNAKHLSSY